MSTESRKFRAKQSRYRPFCQKVGFQRGFTRATPRSNFAQSAHPADHSHSLEAGALHVRGVAQALLRGAAFSRTASPEPPQFAAIDV
jgi:hypothetical protein